MKKKLEKTAFFGKFRFFSIPKVFKFFPNFQNQISLSRISLRFFIYARHQRAMLTYFNISVKVNYRHFHVFPHFLSWRHSDRTPFLDVVHHFRFKTYCFFKNQNRVRIGRVKPFSKMPKMHLATTPKNQDGVASSSNVAKMP